MLAGYERARSEPRGEGKGSRSQARGLHSVEIEDERVLPRVHRETALVQVDRQEELIKGERGQIVF